MRNLQSFIDYKTKCPLCNSCLNLSFCFKSKSKIKIEDGLLVIDVPFQGYPLSKKKFSYTAKFYINQENNSFYLNFLDKDGTLYNVIYLSILNRYFDFLKSQGNGIRFYKECLVCRKYNYTSESLKLNHASGIIEPFQVMTEYLCFGKQFKDFQVYKLLNNYLNNKTSIMSGKAEYLEFMRMGSFNVTERDLPNFMEIPIIDLNNLNLEKLIEKLNLLLILS